MIARLWVILYQVLKVLLVGTPYLELKFIYKIGTSGFDIDTRVIRSLLGDEADFTRLKFIHGLKNI